MNLPDTWMGWLRFGGGALLLLLGLVVAAVNWGILFYNIRHVLVKKDDKHSSFVPLIAFLGIVAGGYLLSPFRPHLAWLVLLDAATLSFLGGLVCLRPFWKTKQADDLIQKSIEAEKRRLSESEGQLRQYISGGELRFLVEWWEKDDLLLVENAHLLFIFADGTYMDFLLHRPIAERLSSVLAEYGIKWTARMEFKFDSCILYPPAYAGQKFYNTDGSTRSDIAL